jgi:uncharacterized protein YjbI with pentapeptide repeats
MNHMVTERFLRHFPGRRSPLRRYSDKYKKATLLKGEKQHFPKNLPQDIRTVHADWIVQAVNKGKLVDVANAVIQGPLNLKYTLIKNELRVKESRFLEEVDLSYATAQRSLKFSGTTFCKAACFLRTTVEGYLACTNTVFKKLALFNRAEFKETVYFGPIEPEDRGKTIFEDQANFRYCSMSQNAYFNRTTFQGVAQFGQAEIGDDAFFRSTCFQSEAAFLGVDIKGDAFFNSFPAERDLRGAIFKGECVFNRAQIGGNAYFRHCTFNASEGTADFGAVTVGGRTSFIGASFEEKADFSGAQLGSDALFHGVHFRGKTYFRSTKVQQGIHFQDAQVWRNGSITDYEGTRFDDLVSFEAATFTPALHLDGEPRKYDFPDDNRDPESTADEVRSMRGDPSSKRLLGPVDLRGCTYDRIAVSSWKDLLAKYAEYMQEPRSRSIRNPTTSWRTFIAPKGTLALLTKYTLSESCRNVSGRADYFIRQSTLSCAIWWSMA